LTPQSESFLPQLSVVGTVSVGGLAAEPLLHPREVHAGTEDSLVYKKLSITELTIAELCSVVPVVRASSHPRAAAVFVLHPVESQAGLEDSVF
jgi:hypothetical protein